MREVVSIHVGQAGIQMGQSLWELYTAEHNLWAEGIPLTAASPLSESVNGLFYESSRGRYRPRAIFADCDPDALNSLRSTPFGQSCVSADRIFNSKCSGASNFARGFHNRESVESTTDQTEEGVQNLIRGELERCDAPAAVHFVHSGSGGAGGGLTFRLSRACTLLAASVPQHAFTLMPSPSLYSNIVEVHNFFLSFNEFHAVAQMQYLFDNEALYDVVRRYKGIEFPSFDDVNEVIARVISSTTAGSRFPASPATTLAEMVEKLTVERQYTALHVITPHYTSIGAIEPRQVLPSVFDPKTSLVSQPKEIRKEWTTKRGQRRLKDVHPRYRDDRPMKHHATCTVVRCTPSLRDAFTPQLLSTSKAQVRTQFAHAFPPTPCDIHTSIVSNCSIPHTRKQEGAPPLSPSKSLQAAKSDPYAVMFSSGSCWRPAFNQMCHDFDVLRCRRAYAHWFVYEGMEEGEYSEARERVAEVMDGYAELEEEIKPHRFVPKTDS